MSRQTPESAVLELVCQYLTVRRVFFWRSNNVPVFRPERGAFCAMPRYSRHGVPDILAVVNGRLLGIEAKSAKGRTSPAQEQFRQDLETAGGVYAVCRDVPDVERALLQAREGAAGARIPPGTKDPA